MPNPLRPDDPPEPMTVTLAAGAVHGPVEVTPYNAPCDNCGHRLGHHTIYFDGNDFCFGRPDCTCKGFVGHGKPASQSDPGRLPDPHEEDPGGGV